MAVSRIRALLRAGFKRRAAPRVRKLNFGRCGSNALGVLWVVGEGCTPGTAGVLIIF